MRLDNSARMNTPGVAAGNWTWRAGDSGVWQRLGGEAQELRRLAFAYNRLLPGEAAQL
jgi:4-alpha-glucanotransferase